MKNGKSWPRVSSVLKNGKKKWLVDGRIMVNGSARGSRFLKKTRQEAESLAETLREKRAAEGSEGDTALTALELIDAVQAMKILRPLGASLAEAAQAYAARKKQGSKTVREAADAYLRALRKRRTGSHYKTARCRLKPFVARYGKRGVGEITKETLQEYLAARQVAPKTRVNDRLYLSGWLGWCVEQEWLAVNPVRRVKPPR